MKDYRIGQEANTPSEEIMLLRNSCTGSAYCTRGDQYLWKKNHNQNQQQEKNNNNNHKKTQNQQHHKCSVSSSQ